MSRRVFQHYFARVSAAFESCPDQLAKELFSKSLISVEAMNRVLTTQGLSASDKATVLVCCIQQMIASDGSDKPLKKLCKVMATHPELEDLASKMTKKFGKYIVH